MLYGPYRRLETPGDGQNALTAVEQALSGEVWGKKVNGIWSPVVEAFGGCLRDGDTGIEFYALARPESAWGRPKWQTVGPRLRVEVDTDGRDVAKLQVAFVKITQDLLDAIATSSH
jgi:hypothetical protein